MSNALTLLEQNKGKLAETLPSYLDPTRMQRLAVSVFRKNPALQKCKPASFVSAIMDAGQLGLEPGLLNEASLVPFKDECTLIVGYKGLMKCAMRSGEIEFIHPYVVYEGDEFYEELGSDPKLIHKPARQPNAKPQYYYAIAKMKSGGRVWEVMSISQIEEHRDKFARGANRTDSAWKTNFDAMAKKTVLRKVCKFLPMSVELQGYFDHEKKSVNAWNQNVNLPEKREAILATPDTPRKEDLQVEVETLKGHLAVAQKEKVDISSIVQDPHAALQSKDASFLRAVNDQLASYLEGF